MKAFYLAMILLLAVVALGAQVNGNIQYFGDKAVLHVWGDHWERGVAQGYYLGEGVMDVFQQFYFTMVAFSNPVYYNYLGTYYQQHFVTDPDLLSEAQGVISGMQQAGVSLYHSGLQRDLGAADLLQANALLDLMQLVQPEGGSKLKLGCASLSSWGVSTLQDTLLAGSSVITRFLDWSLNDALLSNPVLVVHHPSEEDEQEWMSFTYPGLIGGLSGINSSRTGAFLNVGNDHSASVYQNLTPIFWDVRRGLESSDYNSDGLGTSLDVFDSIADGLHLTGTIIHSVSENAGDIVPVVVETNNSGTVARYYNMNGNLSGENLAATNHFRLLTYPTCCTRYANIQDSLNANSNMTAKRQWRVLSGAAGMDDNLAAIQYVPSTGAILWSSATFSLPAFQTPAITLNAQDLFDFPVFAQDELAPSASTSVSCYPNPLAGSAALNLKSSLPLRAYTLFNLRGQKVLSGVFSAPKNELQLDLPGLPNGLYLLRLQDGRGLSVLKKVVVSG